MYRAACLIILTTILPPKTQAQETPPPPRPTDRRGSQEDLAKLQGVWERVGTEVGGLRSSGGGAGWTATYEGDRLTLADDGAHYRTAVVALDASRSPKAINAWDLDGPRADETHRGIYEIDGDILKVCFARRGERRPTEFRSGEGAGLLVHVYRRRGP